MMNGNGVVHNHNTTLDVDGIDVDKNSIKISHNPYRNNQIINKKNQQKPTKYKFKLQNVIF